MKFTTHYDRWNVFRTVPAADDCVKAVDKQDKTVFDGPKNLFDMCFENGFFVEVPEPRPAEGDTHA